MRCRKAVISPCLPSGLNWGADVKLFALGKLLGLGRWAAGGGGRRYNPSTHTFKDYNPIKILS